MQKKTVRDIDLAGKRVLVRVDFNVPLDKSGTIQDDLRIRETIPTLNYLLDKKAKVVIVSHLGRPKNREKHLQMDVVGARLSSLLGKPVKKLDGTVGDGVKNEVAGLKEGDIALLENVRFHPEEEKNDENFSKSLSQLADIYVNDSFGTAHRAHASTAGITKFLPSVAGLLMEKEINYLHRLMESPKHPFTLVVGGAKVSDKLGLIENFIGKASEICIGGGMAFTFLKAKGYEIGKSLYEPDMVEEAKRLMALAKKKGMDIELPVDVVVAEKLEDTAEHSIVSVQDMPKTCIGADIGPDTAKNFSHIVRSSATVFWNGPMGVYEIPVFSVGTRAIADAVAACPGVSVVGGGDIAAALQKMGYTEKVSHISTGGGAALEFLSGEKLPGVVALNDK